MKVEAVGPLRGSASFLLSLDTLLLVTLLAILGENRVLSIAHVAPRGSVGATALRAAICIPRKSPSSVSTPTAATMEADVVLVVHLEFLFI